MNKKEQLKVLSYNIHKGFNSGNRKFILQQIRSAIRYTHADLVFLQEVIGHHEHGSRQIADWPSSAQFEFLAHESWPHYAYGKNAVYSYGHHGNAILSKYPILKWENVDVSTNRLESRGLLHGLVDYPQCRKPVHVICVHLGLMEVERQTQVLALCDRIRAMVPDGDPVIIGGDFNDWRQRISAILQQDLGIQEVFKTLRGTHARTFPSWLPALKLDRIYYRGLQPMEAACFTGKPWSELSDHAALYTELGVA